MLYQRLAQKPNRRKSALKRAWKWSTYNTDVLTAIALGLALLTLLFAASGCTPEVESKGQAFIPDPIKVRVAALEVCDVNALRALDSCESARLEAGLDADPNALTSLRVCRRDVEDLRADCYAPIDPVSAQVVHCNAGCETYYRLAEEHVALGDTVSVSRARENRLTCEIRCGAGVEQ